MVQYPVLYSPAPVYAHSHSYRGWCPGSHHVCVYEQRRLRQRARNHNQVGCVYLKWATNLLSLASVVHVHVWVQHTDSDLPVCVRVCVCCGTLTRVCVVDPIGCGAVTVTSGLATTSLRTADSFPVGRRTATLLVSRW